MSDAAANVEAAEPIQEKGPIAGEKEEVVEPASAEKPIQETTVADAEMDKAVEVNEPASETVENEDNVTTAEVKEPDENEGDAKIGDETTTDVQPMLKTRGRIETKKNNSKFDPSVLPESDDPAKIRTQVEFYFGDSNLPTDKFLWEQTGGTENKPVPIKTICEFGRMRRFKPYEKVVAALYKSTFLEVSGHDGEEVIKRKTAYEPNAFRSKAEGQTVYVKGFGDEEPSTQFDVEAFFTQYGAVNAVRLRRTDEKFFKGSVFVEFQDEETAKKFLELDPKPQWKDHELKIMSKKAYIEEKNEMIREGKIEAKSGPRKFYEGYRNQNNNSRGRGAGAGARPARSDSNNWKERRDKDRKQGFQNGRHGRGGRSRGGRTRGRDGGRRDNRNRTDRSSPDFPTIPVIHATDSNGRVVKKDDVGTKRRREGDAGSSAPPAKKATTETAKADA